MISRQERLQIEIELLEWLFEKSEMPVYKEHYFYSFSSGVLYEKKLKLKACGGVNRVRVPKV